MNLNDVYVWTDPHFFHKNIFKFCPDTRPFTTVEEMNEALITAWNKRTKGKIIYLLGDFSFSKDMDENQAVFDRLEGQKFLLKGNHDHKQTYNLNWNGVYSHKELFVEGHKFILNHYPMSSWNGMRHGSFHLHGHVHGAFVPGKNNLRMLDVGMDNGYPEPITLGEVVDILKDRETKEGVWL